MDVDYSGKGSGLGRTYARSGGRGTVAGQKSGNPFAKLFKKDGGESDKVINFRKVASKRVGEKHGNIFKIISRGYQKAVKKKLLLEYQRKD